MAVDPVVRGNGSPTERRGSPLARLSVAVAAVAALLVVLGVAVFGVAYAVGGEDATSDNWVGAVSVFALLTAVPASLIAFVMAVVAKVRHEAWRALWLPLVVFPAVLAFMVLGELLWWE